MLFEATKILEVGVPQRAVWELVRNVPRLGGCLPGVSGIETNDAEGRFGATVVDRVGPFRIELPVQIEVQAVEEPNSISAGVAGNDRRGQARVRGTLDARLEPNLDGTRLTLTMKMEVLGRLAALGAGPIRRRADEIFEAFARRVGAELGDKTSSAEGGDT